MDPETLERPRTLRRSETGWRKWLISGLFESVLIMVSVVAGLMLTGWAQDQSDKQRVTALRGFIEKEIAANRDLIASGDYLPHHKQLLSEIRKVAELENPTREQATPAFQAITRTGIHLTPTDDSVWRSISPSDLLEHMPPEKVFTLTRVYRNQSDLTLVNETIYGMLTRIPFDMARGDPPLGAIIQLQLSINDLVAAEENLLKQYDAALKARGDGG